ncbi:DJ-1/PfpI family protein [Haploplasma modicum]|uniref:DJ-1/PfpI family protein n=1 Tax=Haploplasma modicum TaxID=2150 RepID=UPI00068DCDB2|nr:DJ-1/PfpI family protein [Haploplasma modicum]
MIKGLMLLNNGVEDVEALATKALLVRAGLAIDFFTLEKTKKIETSYNTFVDVNYLADEVTLENYDFLVLPGGPHVAKWVDLDTKLDKIIEYFNNKKMLIAAICAAPLFLNKFNLLENKEFTAFPSVVRKINGNFVDLRVIKVDNIITSRGAGTVYDFAFLIVKTLLGDDALVTLKEKIAFY